MTKNDIIKENEKQELKTIDEILEFDKEVKEKTRKAF